MVIYNSTAELNTAFASMVGQYDYMDHIHRPDNIAALARANLQPGQSVLEVGAGSGRLIAEAKQAVGGGFCVAVDAVQGFLSTDIPWTLAQKGLTVYPAGGLTQQVHLLRANITEPGFSAAVCALSNTTQKFDCIFALHIFTTLPAHQRRQALINLRRLLSPGGRLIINMSARFPQGSAPPSASNVPVQFQTTPFTEAPGSSVLTAFRTAGSPIQVPGAVPNLPRKDVTLTVQVAPDQFWVTAATQATQAAQDTGFNVNSVHHIGKGNSFGLPNGRRSPSQTQLNAMSSAQLEQLAQTPPQLGTYSCIGRFMQTWLRRRYPELSQMPPQARDGAHARALQEFVVRDKDRVLANNRFLPADGIVAETLDWLQVGVMLVLVPM
jgi:SAM-dependent methyltransferase